MSYEPTVWQTGDTVTAEKLNKLEQGVANAGGILIVTQSGSPLTLDKTWQEINSALLPLLVVTITGEEGGTEKHVITITSIYGNDGEEPYYDVQFKNDIYECSSPTDYPVLVN